MFQQDQWRTLHLLALTLNEIGQIKAPPKVLKSAEAQFGPIGPLQLYSSFRVFLSN